MKIADVGLQVNVNLQMHLIGLRLDHVFSLKSNRNQESW